jgi:hypothetical protein
MHFWKRKTNLFSGTFQDDMGVNVIVNIFGNIKLLWAQPTVSSVARFDEISPIGLKLSKNI